MFTMRGRHHESAVKPVRWLSKSLEKNKAGKEDREPEGVRIPKS